MFKFIYIGMFIYQSSLFALTNSIAEENIFYNSVVFTKSEAPDSKGDTTPGFCNATLLSKNMAITAAHCVSLAYVSGMKKITIEKGAYKYKQLPDGTNRKIGYVPISTKIVNAEIEFSNTLKDKMDRNGFKTKISPSEDVAIIWWHDETDIFSQTSYPEIASVNEFNLIIKSISNYSTSVVSINPFSEMSIDTKRIAKLNNTKWKIGNYVESKSTSRVEEGDSGAPLFVNINSKNKIFGVVKGLAKTVFDNWDAYSSVSEISCEINKRLPSEFKLSNCSR